MFTIELIIRFVCKSSFYTSREGVLSKSCVEYVNFIDEGSIVTMCVAVCILCIATSNQKILIGGV